MDKELKLVSVNVEDRLSDELYPIHKLELQTKKKKKKVVDYKRDESGSIVFKAGLPVAEEFETVLETIAPAYHNAVNMLLNHPKYAERIRYDVWNHQIEYKLKEYDERAETWSSITDTTENEIAYWFGCHYRVSFPEKMISRAIDQIAHRNTYDPFIEKIDKIVKEHPIDDDWIKKHTVQGATPLDRMLEEYFGVCETEIARIYSRRYMIGALRRAYYGIERGGVKHDEILILYGETGIGKSTAIRILALDDDFYQDQGFKIGDKDVAQYFQGVFLYELKELSNRSTPEREKQFYEQEIDTVRLPYERRAKKIIRRCSFIGTTNRSDILHDATGNRRFLPVICGREMVQVAPNQKEPRNWKKGTMFPLEELRKAAPVLWAEAYYWMKKGEPHHLNADEQERQRKSNIEFESVHPWTERIYKSAREQFYNEERVSVSNLFEELSIPIERRDHRARATVEMILTRLGYRKGRRGPNKRRGWYPI